MKKILYIAFYFPPLGGVASIRSLKNVRYLSLMGYEVQVLTVRTAWMRHPRDRDLLAELPAKVKIWRSFFPDPNWLFKILYGLKLHAVVKFIRQRVLIPDPERLWRPFAKRRLKQILQNQHDFQAAIISSGPPSSLSLGLWLKSRYGIPYICDFRDEWTNNPERINLDFPAPTQSRELMMESQILIAAAGIAYLTPRMRENFESRYPFLAKKPAVVIPNGFDENDFNGLIPSNNQDKFHLVYSGSFYDRRQPDPLWQVILELVGNGSIEPGSLGVDIFGKNTVSFVLGSYAQNDTIRQMVKFHKFQPHRHSLQELMKADALLLFIPSGKNAQSVLTGKIFDYLRSGKPILAIVPPDGIAAELVSKAGTGFVADYEDIRGIGDHLYRLYEMWKAQELASIKPDLDYISGFSRRKLTANLASLIEEVAL